MGFYQKLLVSTLRPPKNIIFVDKVIDLNTCLFRIAWKISKQSYLDHEKISKFENSQ